MPKSLAYPLALAWILSGSWSLAQKAPDVTKLDPAMAVNKGAASDLDWYDVTTWGVEGRILPEQDRTLWFDR